MLLSQVQPLGRPRSFPAAAKQLRSSGGCRRRCRLAVAARMPSRGYFSEADPKAEIYARGPKKFDPRKKPGRWEPEFIWQTNWQEALKFEEDQKKQQERAAAEKAKPVSVASPSPSPKAGAGMLSLARVAELERLDTDLSPVLTQTGTAAESSSNGSGSGSGSSGTPDGYLSIDIFTTKKSSTAAPAWGGKSAERWRRAQRFSSGASSPTLDEVDESAIQAEQEQYQRLKVELQAWTLALTGAGFAVCWFCYTKDVGVSYALGGLAGLLYLRMLNNNVDTMGKTGLEGLAGGMSSPRLLIPAALVVVYSRWNVVMAESTGVHVQLLPMLLGFFMYKAATVGRQAVQIMGDMSQDVTSVYDEVPLQAADKKAGE